ncbi:MAG: MBL fold metallo-hydrolase [Gemmatimonadaceae bacterium]
MIGDSATRYGFALPLMIAFLSLLEGPRSRALTAAIVVVFVASCGNPENSESPNRSAPTSSENDPARANPGAKSRAVVVRVLDVGQGDATLIENGGSRVLIDGGPEASRLGVLLDSLGLNGTTIDAVILSHSHADHLIGLRELFDSRRRIAIRYFFENGDPSPAANLRHLRDSIGARVARRELVFRRTDDPCANGGPICTLTMKGGAKIEVMRPMPGHANPNNRSTPVKLIGSDSASFTMWFAGDAEQEEIAWFLGEAHYDENPGMRATILKADHHGSCNGVTSAYLDAIQPAMVTASVGAANSYHHMHTQAQEAYRAKGIVWYRTDENGTITITSPGTPGGKFSVRPQRGGPNLSGQSDSRSTQAMCNPIP